MRSNAGHELVGKSANGIARFTASLLIALLPACSTVLATSVRYDQDPGRLHEGVPYSLPRTAIECRVSFADPKAPSVSMKTHTVPDPGQQYLLRHNRCWWYDWCYDDKLIIETSVSGFVSSIVGESTDQTLVVVKGLGELAVAFAKARLGAAGGAPPALNVPLPDGVKQEKVDEFLAFCWTRMTERCEALKGRDLVMFTALPDQPADRTRPVLGEAAFPGAGADFSVALAASRLDRSGAAAPPEQGEARDGAVARAHSVSPAEVGGVLVRGQERYVLEETVYWDPAADEKMKAQIEVWKTQPGGADAWAVVEAGKSRYFAVGSSTLLAPVFDYAPVSVIAVERAAFVNAKTTVTFSDGILTKVDINRPSSFGALVNSPVAIAKSLVSIPAQLVQLKVDTATAKEKEEAKEAEEREKRLKERNQRLKAYYAAKDAASSAIAAYRSADWTGKDAEQRTAKAAIMQRMLDANIAADLADEPRPYGKSDFDAFSP